MKGDIVTDGHLGGYVEGGDDATFYPELFCWLVKEQNVQSVLDVGCGSGVSVDYFHKLGVNVFGVDGIPQEHGLIYEHDFTKGTFFHDHVDLVWSCEFLEHVEEKYLPNVLDTFISASPKWILVTHAFPGQDGFHHVNCRNPEYWIGVMAAIGYRFDALLTAQARAQAAFNQSPYNHFTRSGICFVKY